MTGTTNATVGWRNLKGSGNPNGAVAGNISDQYFDNTGFNLWQCSISGNSSTAVWVQMNGASSASNALILANAASTANIAGTYNNGTAGVGATFTWTATGPQALDTQTVVLNGLYVLWFQSASLQNGVYLCTTAPATGVNGVLTRATNYNTPALIQSNIHIKVLAGSVWKGVILNCPTVSITIGTTALLFTTMIFCIPSSNAGSASALLTISFNPGTPQFSSISPSTAGVYQSTGSIMSFSTTLPTGLTIPQPLINGVTAGTAAAAGKVGEVISSVISVGSPVSITTGLVSDLTSISLTAGDWDVWGNINYISNGITSLGNTAAWISSTSATAPANQFYAAMPSDGVSGSALGFVVPSLVFNVSTTTTVFLSQVAAFSLSTQTICGGIYARRRH